MPIRPEHATPSWRCMAEGASGIVRWWSASTASTTDRGPRGSSQDRGSSARRDPASQGGRSGDVTEAATLLDEAGVAEGVRLWAMVETPAAVLDVAGLARTAVDPASRLDVLVMGTNDLAKDLRVRLTPKRDALLVWLSTCVAAARSQRLDILDGVFNDLDDASGLVERSPAGPRFRHGRQDLHPSGPDRSLQRRLRPSSRTNSPGLAKWWRLSRNRRTRQRAQDRRPHGRAAACRGSATHARCRGRPGGARPWRALVGLSRSSQVCLHLRCEAALILLRKSQINRGFRHARLPGGGWSALTR